jgi:ubiquitin C-terminal hydrolase
MKIPVFPNLGNTCYLSCVLQSLLHSKGFVEHLNGLETPLAQELIKISKFIDNNNDGVHNAVLYNIKDLINLLPFHKYEQQDAHECILYFLDNLENKNNKNMYNLFHGHTETCFHCLRCGTKKMAVEPFNSINLNIPNKTSNVVELFQKYLEPEQFLEQDLYFCNTCNDLTQYEKKINLSILPEVLIIVLKRYTSVGAKIESDVHFGSEIKVRQTHDDTVKEYKLKSVINHFGNLLNGHYTNFLHENMWLFIDDERVKPENCVIDNAYILFYEKF